MAKAKRKRYSAAEKQEIIDFVKDFNKSNKGRGGQAAASKKYKVSQLSISNWLKGGTSPKKKVSKKKAAPTDGSVAKGSIASTLKRMTAIQEDISTLTAEYEALKKQL